MTHTHHTNAVVEIINTPTQNSVPKSTMSDIKRLSPTVKNNGGAIIAKVFQRITWTGMFFIVFSKSSILYLIWYTLKLMCYF